MSKLKFLTWEDLAEFYKKKTGWNARIQPMDDIYEWALKQPEIKKHKDGALSVKK